ncbi:uncharacterized protein F5147DRAFT_587724, partial [Suillus discolor]
RLLPIWFHIGASKELKKFNNHLHASCLRDNHNITSVSQLETTMKRYSPHHRQNKDCPCEHCLVDRTSYKCNKPFKCVKLAKEIMNCLLLKWHPNNCSPSYALNIAPEQSTENDDQGEANIKIFDPIFPSPDTLETGFRAFVKTQPQSTLPASQTTKPPGNPPQLINIVIAGTHQVNKDREYMSGGGAWISHDNPQNVSIKIPEPLAGPGAGEIGALLTVVTNLPKDAPIHCLIRSQKLRKDLTINLPRQEDAYWLEHPHKLLMTALVVSLRT